MTAGRSNGLPTSRLTRILAFDNPHQIDSAINIAEVRREQMISLSRQAPINALVCIGISIAAGTVLWNNAPSIHIIAWMIVVWGLSLLLLDNWRRYRNRQLAGVSERGPRKATISSLLHGMTWGSTIVLFFPVVPETHQLLLVIIVTGMSAGASTTLAAIPAAAAAYILGCLLPGIGYFFVQDDPVYLAIATMGLILMLAMLLSTRHVYSSFIDSIRTRMENASLLAQFQNERSEWLQISDTSEAFALFDSDDRLLLWNENYRRMLSLPEAAMVRGAERRPLLRQGAAPADGSNPDDWIETQLKLHETPGQPVIEQLSNGRWLRSSARRTNNGRTVSIHVDITELKDRESALLQAHQELARRSAEVQSAYDQLEDQHRKLEQARQHLIAARDEALRANWAKSEFLANMSHELRTPLNTVLGFSQVMESEMFGPLGNPRYAEYSKNIYDSGAHLLDLINDILDLSKVEAGKLELSRQPARMNDLIAACRPLVVGEAQRAGVRLVFQGDCETWPELSADETKLKQILLNLLSNAIKFTPRDGSVSLTTRRTPEGDFEFAVTDTGIGMRPEDIPKVLEPFQRLESAHNTKYPGTGLGLPLSKALIELHDGSLRIESTLGKGTTVTAMLPAAAAFDAKAQHEA